MTIEDPTEACGYHPHSLRAIFHPDDPRIAALIPERSLRAWPRSDGWSTSLPAAGRYGLEWVAGVRGKEFPLDVGPVEVDVVDGHQVLDLRLPLEEWERFKAAWESGDRPP